MKLQIGKAYRDGWGDGPFLVMGPTRTDEPGLVWTLQGFHYRKSDGRKAPLSVPNEKPSLKDLVEEVPVPEYWADVAAKAIADNKAAAA